MFLFIILLGELKSILHKNRFTLILLECCIYLFSRSELESRQCLSVLGQYTMTKEFVEGRVYLGLRVTGEKSGSWQQVGGA